MALGPMSELSLADLSNLLSERDSRIDFLMFEFLNALMTSGCKSGASIVVILALLL